MAINLASFTYMVPLGFGSASAVLVGRAIGEQDMPHARRVAASALVAGAAYMSLSACVLLVSLGIAALTSALVYLALHYLFVRPMRRLTANLVGFHENPESAARIIVPSQRGDEIGVAGATTLFWLMTITLVVMLAANGLLGVLLSRVPLRRSITITLPAPRSRATAQA